MRLSAIMEMGMEMGMEMEMEMIIMGMEMAAMI